MSHHCIYMREISGESPLSGMFLMLFSTIADATSLHQYCSNTAQRLHQDSASPSESVLQYGLQLSESFSESRQTKVVR